MNRVSTIATLILLAALSACQLSTGGSARVGVKTGALAASAPVFAAVQTTKICAAYQCEIANGSRTAAVLKG